MNWMKLSIGSAALLIGGAACSLEPRVDTGSNPAAAAAAANGGMGMPGGGIPPGTPGSPYPYAYPCKIDTRTVVDLNGRFLEIVTARGRLFEFENGVPVQPGVGMPQFAYPPGIAPPGAPPYPVGGTPGYPGYPNGAGYAAIDLMTIPLYAQGPCLGRPLGTCTFETHAFARLPEGRLLEYVTAFGRQWTFENSQMTGAGVDIGAIPRYQDICMNRGITGGLCKFDTRTFLKIGNELVESITAYGRRWQYNVDGGRMPDNGIDLLQVPQYANGPCRIHPPGTPCIFETRSFEPGVGGQLIETITAYGLAYRFLSSGADVQAGQGVPVSSTPHWAVGPCR